MDANSKKRVEALLKLGVNNVEILMTTPPEEIPQKIDDDPYAVKEGKNMLFTPTVVNDG